MKTTNELIIEYYEKYGGLYHGNDEVIRDVVHRFDSILSGHRSNRDADPLSKKDFPNIQFGIVDFSKRKASVRKINDRYIIIFSLQIISEIQECIIRTLSDEFMSKVEEIAGYVDEKLGSHMFDCIIDFIFEHELAHIMNGHIDYKAEIGGLDFYEHDEIKYGELSIELESALEINADTNGFANCFQWFYKQPEVQHLTSKISFDRIEDLQPRKGISEEQAEQGKARLRSMKKLQEKRVYFENSLSSIKYLLISLGVYFTFIESLREEFTKLENLKEHTHRDPRIRFLGIIHTIKPALDGNKSDIDPNELMKTCFDILNFTITSEDWEKGKYNYDNYLKHPDGYGNEKRRMNVRDLIEPFAYRSLS